MKYTYETATGKVTVDVGDDWERVLLDFDDAITANDHKHRRNDRKKVRMIFSLEALRFEGDIFCDRNVDLLGDVIREDEHRELREHVSRLPEPLAEIIRLYYYEGLQDADIAARFGCKRQNIQQRRKTALKKLLKSLLFSAGVDKR